jgi:hypothetical protein
MQHFFLRVAAVAAVVWALAAGAPARASEKPVVKITDVVLRGVIEGENISFDLSLKAEPERRHPEFALLSGDLVLDEAVSAGKRHEIRFDSETKTYFIKWRWSSTRTINASFACRPALVEGYAWREAQFAIPAANARELEVVCDRADLEIQFPGAVKFERVVKDGVLTAKALLGPGRPFTVRWKPQVQQLESKLVMASEANTIVTAGTGALRLSSLFAFTVSQGKLKQLAFTVPKELSITQVRSTLLQDWHLADLDGTQVLTVTLSRPETGTHAIEVTSEVVLGNLPTTAVLPVIEPRDVIRSSGTLAIGTDSALRLVVTEPRGISQVDVAAFPRMVLDRAHPRPLPRANAFFYTYATVPYHVKLSVEDIVSSYDAYGRFVITAREENVTVDCDIDLEVRDAPLRALRVMVDKGLMVSKAEGAQVAEYVVRDAADGRQEVEVTFASPVTGRTQVKMRLELSDAALDARTRVGSIAVVGAKSERGWVAIAAEEGIELDAPAVQDLREVHTDSLPMKVPGALHAFRYRESSWGVTMLARKKKPSVRAESFHLVSIGDGIAYGNVAVSYFVAGAPVDQLAFRIPARLRNVEFVSRDVRRWSAEDELWTVQLQRKIVGDYTVLITYTQEVGEDGLVLAGGVRAEGLDAQTGFICVASNLNVDLQQTSPLSKSLLQIDREEVPVAYRLQINAPLLKTYKYTKPNDGIRLTAKQYDRGQLVQAVIEQTELTTSINVNNEREAQSRTTVRYKVKNSRGQFLALDMPADADIWSVHLVKTGEDGSEQLESVGTSVDKEKRVLLVPLERRRNPNDPLTVQVVYARTHGRLVLAGTLGMIAPASRTHSTYTRWDVSVPTGWAVYAGGEGMPATPREVEERGLAGLLALVAEGVWYPFDSGEFVGLAVTAGIVAAVVLLVIWFYSRRAFAIAAGVVVAIALIGLATIASAIVNQRLAEGATELTEISFERSIDLDASSAAIDLRVLPSWRRHATAWGAIVVPALALAAFAGAFLMKGLRAPLVALGATGVVYAAVQFPVLWVVLTHVFVWVLPMAVAWLALRAALRRTTMDRSAVSPAAVALLACLCWPAGVAEAASDALEAGTADSVEVVLKAEADHVTVDVTLVIDEDGPVGIPLIGVSAILLSPDEDEKVYEVARDGGRYVLKVLKPRERTIALKFLLPIAPAKPDGLRSLEMVMPPALRNRVTLSIPETNLEVESPSAVRLVREEKDGATVATAVFGPTDACSFIWKPRARKTHLERTAFYAEVTSLAKLGLGVAECRHLLRLQVAQGEVRSVAVVMPAGMTVTAVEGALIGTWRFDPAVNTLEVHLTRPATGALEIVVLTQAPVEAVPYDVSIATPTVVAAERQRGVIGIAATNAVYVEVVGQPARMNVEDFSRDAQALLAASSLDATALRGAYRVLKPDDAVKVAVQEVKPELRATENASFDVGDDRLVYNGEIDVLVAKTGVFGLTLAVPQGYDVDSLVATGLSHWDDGEEAGRRMIQMHFANQTLGNVKLKLAMSRSLAQMPEEIVMPRIEVVGAAKHTGTLRVASDRGVRLSVRSRTAVSELNPLELGIREKGVLAFRLLGTDWELKLKSEVVETRTVVDFLHVVRISEDVVRYSSYLNYRLYNAGSRVLEIQVPKDVLSLEIVGPETASIKETPAGSGLWRVELARKWYDEGRPYRLSVAYQTSFDLKKREVAIQTARAVGVDLQRGYVAAYATDKVEITPVTRGAELQPADARSIARSFGAGDLSGAAYCYTTSTPEYQLTFDAVRHDMAQLLEARVRSVRLTTVVAESGHCITKAVIDLSVGGKRYLEAVLPRGAEVWSLLTDGRSAVPSHRERDGEPILMLPLGQASSNEMPVRLEIVYVNPAPAGWRSGRPEFIGPRLDLPLNDMVWDLYLPVGFAYDDFKGNLVPEEGSLQYVNTAEYVPGEYDRRL